MSLRRKSCNACFKGRRKCDLGLPSCTTCLRTRKTCEYSYRRRISNTDTSDKSNSPQSSTWATGGSFATGQASASAASLDDAAAAAAPDTLLDAGAFTDMDFDRQGQLPGFQGALASGGDGDALLGSGQVNLALLGIPPDPASVPRLLGALGEIQAIEGTNESWQWAIEELKSFPLEFAQHSKTIFINSMSYRDDMPASIRRAMGVSAMCCVLNDNNSDMLFRSVDGETLEILNTSGEASLQEELARLQALVIYQIARYFYGGLEQRILAEQQQGLINARAMKLLMRLRGETTTGKEVGDWRAWILAESVRRTVMMSYMVYGVNTVYREGVCLALPTLAKLPMSAAFASWDSEADHDRDLESGVTMPYETFNSLWNSFMPRKLDPFEKLLIVPCRGIDAVTASESLEEDAMS